MDPERRYAPVVHDIMRSKEAREIGHFMEKIPRDPLAHKIMKEVEWFGDEYLDDHNFDRDGYRAWDIRERPSRENKERMSRMEADK